MAEKKGVPDTFKIEELDSLFPESQITDATQLAAVARENASDYLYAGRVLYEHIGIKSGVASACAVLAAFSCELHLKSIMYSTGEKKVSGHSLEELFNKLPTNIRDEILNEIERNDPENYFMSGLKENSDVFASVRYLFERTRTSFNPWFLLSFSQLLGGYIASKG